MKSSELWLAAICLVLTVICAVIASFYGVGVLGSSSATCPLTASAGRRGTLLQDSPPRPLIEHVDHLHGVDMR